MTLKNIPLYIARLFCIGLGLIVFDGNGLQAQGSDKFQVGGFVAPSYENLAFRNLKEKSPFYYKFSYNFGGYIKYYWTPIIATNIGLQFNDKGFRSIIEYQEEELSDAVLAISAKYITVPLNLSINFQPAYRTELYVTVGGSYGYLVHQSYKGKRIPPEQAEIVEEFYPGAVNERTTINWFDRSYLGLDVGVGVSRYFGSRVVLTVQPMYHRQMDRLEDPYGALIVGDQKPKFDSFSLQIKLAYYISDQIENTKKTL